MKLSYLPATIASSKEVSVPDDLAGIQTIEVKDELKVYEELSRQLILMEKNISYSLNKVADIEQQAQQMIIEVDEKAELLMRCDWLVTMKDIEQQLPSTNSLEAVQAAKRQLGRVQTCPLKNELKAKLKELEARYTTTKVLSPKEKLVEDAFATGNETFIDLGIAGREYVLDMVLKETPSVELAIAKAEELEARVQASNQLTTIEQLESALQELPLAKLADVPAEYKEEVLQKLIDQPNWNGLFHLDCLIHQYTVQLTSNTKNDNEAEQAFISIIDATEDSLQQFGIK